LGQEGPEGGGGGVQAVAEGTAAVVEGGMDHVGRQVFGDGESFSVVQRPAGLGNLADKSAGGSLRH
jgi:hypothetical protein